MSFLDFVITLAIIGGICWGVSLAPIPAGIKKVIYVIAIVVIVGVVLGALGLWDKAKSIQIPKI